MTADAWAEYNQLKEDWGQAVHDMDGDTFKMGASTSTYTVSAEHEILSEITNEVSGNGYAQQTLASLSWSRSTGTVTWDVADVTFGPASGGSIVGRTWWIYNDTPTSPLNPLMFYTVLDNTPADVSIADGDSLLVEIDASGVMTLS